MRGHVQYILHVGKKEDDGSSRTIFSFHVFVFLGPSVYLDGKHCIDVHGISIYGYVSTVCTFTRKKYKQVTRLK